MRDRRAVSGESARGDSRSRVPILSEPAAVTGRGRLQGELRRLDLLRRRGLLGGLPRFEFLHPSLVGAPHEIRQSREPHARDDDEQHDGPHRRFLDCRGRSLAPPTDRMEKAVSQPGVAESRSPVAGRSILRRGENSKEPLVPGSRGVEGCPNAGAAARCAPREVLYRRTVLASP